jgi:hypothetical protein
MVQAAGLIGEGLMEVEADDNRMVQAARQREDDGDRERGQRIAQGAERIGRKLRKAARECCRRPNERGK